MAYIRHISPSQAGGRLAHIYEEIRSEVPRVPNLMQVFSLRPETMAWVYRSWLTSMWNGGLGRTEKEVLAVAVSKAAHCNYCVDAHMVFLQAAGMNRAKAFEVEHMLEDCESLEPALRVAVRFATKVTNDPRGLNDADREELARHWPEPGQLAEVCSVISAFNCITRVANALGVDAEIPRSLRRFDVGRRGAITLLSRLTALSVDLGEKSIPSETPEENQRALEFLFVRQLGFPTSPPGFDRLREFPDHFNSQLRLIEKAFVVVPRDRLMRIGLVVGRLTGCGYFAKHCAGWLTRRAVDVSDVVSASEGGASSLPETEASCLRFARDLTLYSHKIGEEQIEALRAAGLSDGAILDLAFVAGMFNGMTRFVLSLVDEKPQMSGVVAAGRLAGDETA